MYFFFPGVCFFSVQQLQITQTNVQQNNRENRMTVERSVRLLVTVVVSVVVLLSILPPIAKAQPAAHVDFDYGERKFLVTPLDEDFCGSVPNPSSMQLFSVSDWNKLVNY